MVTKQMIEAAKIRAEIDPDAPPIIGWPETPPLIAAGKIRVGEAVYHTENGRVMAIVDAEIVEQQRAEILLPREILRPPAPIAETIFNTRSTTLVMVAIAVWTLFCFFVVAPTFARATMPDGTTLQRAGYGEPHAKAEMAKWKLQYIVVPTLLWGVIGLPLFITVFFISRANRRTRWQLRQYSR